MKKRIVLLVLLITMLVTSVSLFSGCSKKVGLDVAYENMMKAYENSLKEDIYYYKLVDYYGDDMKNIISKNVNVFSPLERKKGEYVFNKDENGNYKDLKITANYSDLKAAEKKTIYTNYTATLANKASNKDEMFDVIKKEEKVDSKDVQFTYITATAKEFIESKVFQETFELKTLLAELGQIKMEDIIFDPENKLYADKGVNVSNFYFALKDSYYENYLAKYGVESALKGDKIFVETAYNRISNIAVYRKDTSSVIAIDEEIYNLKIVYYGPKIGNIFIDDMNKDNKVTFVDEIV